MTKGLRAESADFEVVFHYCERLAQFVHARRKKLPLIREARSPREHATDIQPFAFDLLEHVLRRDALGRTRVMRAASAVDMMVAAVETVRRWFNPAFELDGEACLRT